MAMREKITDSEVLRTLKRWPSLRTFLAAMATELDENRGKGGWQDDEPHDLATRVLEESAELYAAMRDVDVDQTNDVCLPAIRKAMSEAVDVGNMAMMTFDRLMDTEAMVLLDEPEVTDGDA